MIGNPQLTKRILISPDFGEFQLSLKQMSGSSTITVQNGVLTCSSVSTNEPAYVLYNLYLPRGSFAEVICEMKGSGAINAGGLGYNQFSTAGSIGGSLIETIPAIDNEWRPYKMTVPADVTKPYTQLLFGVWTNGVATYSFRNVEINVYNGHMISPEVRICRILGGGNTWTWEEAVTGQRNFGITSVSVVSSSGLLRVNFEPFKNWDNPIILAQMQHVNNRYGYICQTGSVTNSYAELQIVDKTGNPVRADSLSGVNAIQFMAIGV